MNNCYAGQALAGILSLGRGCFVLGRAVCYFVGMGRLKPVPDLSLEDALWCAGARVVAGVDEAGRGALAGPVVAAAVVVPAHDVSAGVWGRVRDSKLLTASIRAELEVEIQQAAQAWAVGVSSAAEVDEAGVALATRVAMARAIEELAPRPDYLLIDWVRLPQLNIAQTSLPKADQRSVSVAAASILAKVHRDRLLVALHGDYPDYGFASNKGYGAPQHLAAIERLGPCPQHRLSFAPLAQRPTLFDADAPSGGAP